MARVLKLIWHLAWAAICVSVFTLASAPLAPLVALAGALVGALGGVRAVGIVLAGRHETLSPAAVAAGRLPGQVAPRFIRRDRAWPQYFAAQARLDLVGAARLAVRDARAIWARLTRPLRPKTGRKVFYLWPLLAIGAAALVGAAAGAGAVLAVDAAVTVAAALAAWTIGLTQVMMLRGFDRVWQKAFRAGGSCPQCYMVSDIPAYRCPGSHDAQERHDGDDLHRDVRPGRLGVWWRRCACGKRLPTTVLRASRRMEARCPFCRAAMHKGAAVATDMRVPVFGATSSGKTHLVVSALYRLLDTQPPLSGIDAATLIDEHSRRRYEEYRELIVNDRPLPKTDASSKPIAVTVKLTSGRRTTLMHVFDAAGEALADESISATYAYLDFARTLVFVLDPFSISAFRDPLDGGFAEIVREANAAATDPETAYQATVSRLRLSGVRTDRQRLAFVLSKRDLMARIPVGDPPPVSSPEVREWLMNHDLSNLIIGAERDFADVRFFAVASGDGALDGPVAPFLWLLNADRLPARRAAANLIQLGASSAAKPAVKSPADIAMRPS